MHLTLLTFLKKTPERAEKPFNGMEMSANITFYHV